MEGCNAVKLHAKTEGTEKIKYVDFTSLYLTVNNYDKYPIGHLVMIVQDFENIEYFGVAKVKLLPPIGICTIQCYHTGQMENCLRYMQTPRMKVCFSVQMNKVCS